MGICNYPAFADQQGHFQPARGARQAGADRSTAHYDKVEIHKGIIAPSRSGRGELAQLVRAAES
jgi:hypothetical protein